MKKVLVVTYYWPPAGGPGVQRWLKFVTHLREFGVEPVLYIPKNAEYPIKDYSLLAEIPPDIRTFSYPVTEPLQWVRGIFGKEVKRISSGIISERKPGLLERVLLWIRGNFFIPDARILWVKPSVAYLQKQLAAEKFDTLLTTGPPHSVHLIGLRLQQLTGIKWVADFRDPWTSIGYHDKMKLGNIAKRKHQKMEAEVLRTADKVLVTSRTTKREFQAITKRPVMVVTNGYEAAEYDDRQVTVDRNFSLSHIGSLLSGRNPEALWRALQGALAENELLRKKFRLRLVGVVSHEVLESIRQFELLPYLEHLDYMAHSEAVNLQRQSQLLLLIEIDSEETQGILPGKLFEYLAARRPVLAIGPRNWEAGDILRKAEAGAVFDYDSAPLIKKKLLEWFTMYRDGDLKVDAGSIEKFSRREITRKLAKELIWE